MYYSDKGLQSYSREEIFSGKCKNIWFIGFGVITSSLLISKNIWCCFYGRSFEDVCAEPDVYTKGEILICGVTTIPCLLQPKVGHRKS